MDIPLINLKKINEPYLNEFNEVMTEVGEKGWYIKGSFLQKFQKGFAEFCGVEQCVGVGNGLDAIFLIFKALKELNSLKSGDEVIVPANTFIASALGLTRNNLIPIFVDIDPSTFNLDIEQVEKAISPKTKAILAVHLYGKLCEMEALDSICKKYNLILIEDAAQAHGAKNSRGERAGSFGVAAGFSFYPTKNLGALGDGGAVTTNNQELAEMVELLGNYGSKEKYHHEYQGVNSRLDELQAGFLSKKLKDLDAHNMKRREIAGLYQSIEHPEIEVPKWSSEIPDHVFHMYVIRTKRRDELKEYLKKKGINSSIHYPQPLSHHKSMAAYPRHDLSNSERTSKEILSLPMSQALTVEEVNYIVEAINMF